jgi:hypothetical protein
VGSAELKHHADEQRSHHAHPQIPKLEHATNESGYLVEYKDSTQDLSEKPDSGHEFR